MTNKAQRKRQRHTGSYVSSPMFAMTKGQHDAIIHSINVSFKCMVQGHFTQRQWLDVLTRMYVGKYMIDNFYAPEVAVEFAPCLIACRLIERRAALQDHDKWDMTDAEKYFLELGLDAVERIQYECMRRDFLLAHRYADIEITKVYIESRKSIEKGLL